MWSKVWFSSFISFDNEITMWLYYVVYICFGHTLRVCWLESKVGWNGSILDFHNGTHICVCLEGWSGSIFVFSWRDQDEWITDCVSVCRCLAPLSVKQAPLSLPAWACSTWATATDRSCFVPTATLPSVSGLHPRPLRYLQLLRSPLRSSSSHYCLVRIRVGGGAWIGASTGSAGLFALRRPPPSAMDDPHLHPQATVQPSMLSRRAPMLPSLHARLPHLHAVLLCLLFVLCACAREMCDAMNGRWVRTGLFFSGQATPKSCGMFPSYGQLDQTIWNLEWNGSISPSYWTKAKGTITDQDFLHQKMIKLVGTLPKITTLSYRPNPRLISCHEWLAASYSASAVMCVSLCCHSSVCTSLPIASRALLLPCFDCSNPPATTSMTLRLIIWFWVSPLLLSLPLSSLFFIATNFSGCLWSCYVVSRAICRKIEAEKLILPTKQILYFFWFASVPVVFCYHLCYNFCTKQYFGSN